MVYKNVLLRKYFPALDIRVIKENYMLWVLHPLLYCIYFQFVKFRLVKMYLMQKMKGNLCECIWNKLSQRIVRGVQLSCFDCNCCARTSRVLSREALPGISTRTLLVHGTNTDGAATKVSFSILFNSTLSSITLFSNKNL